MKISFITIPNGISGGEVEKSMLVSPPITHLWLAAVLLEAGHEVDILDALSLGMGIEDLEKHIEKEKPDMVGFTVFTAFYKEVLFVTERLKKRFPYIKTVVGGYHVNSIPEDFFLPYIDYIFEGEAEFSLRELMNRLREGNYDCQGIPGLIARDVNGDWQKNPVDPFRTNMDEQPILPYELILDNHYNTWWTSIDPSKEKYMATVSGKGCPMACTFCDIGKTEGKKIRAMGSNRLLKEFEYLQSLGVTHVELRDANFTTSRQHLIDLAQGMIEKEINIEWGCSSTLGNLRAMMKKEARGTGGNINLLELLYKSGCRFIFLGVESGNPEILYREKRVTIEETFQVIKAVQKAGIQAHSSFIFGLEGDTIETMQQTMDLSLALKPDTASYSIASPYPGTKLYDSFHEKGYLTTYDWSLYNATEPVFETEHVKKEDLKRFLEDAHRRFYFRPSYILRKALKVTSFRQFFDHAKIAYQMFFNVTAYKN